MSADKDKPDVSEPSKADDDFITGEELTDQELEDAHGGALRLQRGGSQFDTLFAGASNFDTLFAGAADLSPNLISQPVTMPGDLRIDKLKR